MPDQSSSVENSLEKLFQIKKQLEEALQNSDLKGWKIKQVVLVKKDIELVDSSCQIVRLPNGDYEVICT